MVITDTRKPFALWFRALLDDREMSQADAARRLGISTGRVSEWLTGKMRPSAQSCLKIARTFMVDEDQVLVAAGRRSADPHYDPDSPEAKLLPYIRAIDWSKHDRELALIQRQLEFMAEVDRGEHDR